VDLTVLNTSPIILNARCTNNEKSELLTSPAKLMQEQITSILISIIPATIVPEAFVFHFAIQKYKDVNTYKTVTLNVDLYGCATWTVTLREEHKLTVFESRVLEKLLWPKK